MYGPAVSTFFFYSVVVVFAMVRNSMGIPYSWLFRPRFLVYVWYAIEVYMFPDTLNYGLWLMAGLLAAKTLSGFIKIRRQIPAAFLAPKPGRLNWAFFGKFEGFGAVIVFRLIFGDEGLSHAMPSTALEHNSVTISSDTDPRPAAAKEEPKSRFSGTALRFMTALPLIPVLL